MKKLFRWAAPAWLTLALLTTGIAVAAPVTATTPAASSTSAAPAATPTGDKIDINSATAEQLGTLPGIGIARSASIVKNRPYKRKDELVSRKIIPAAVYNNIKEQIIAKQS